jgi:hypothetical protein
MIAPSRTIDPEERRSRRGMVGTGAPRRVQGDAIERSVSLPTRLPKRMATVTGKTLADRPDAAGKAASRLLSPRGDSPEKAELAQRRRAVAEGAQQAIAGSEAAQGAWSKVRSVLRELGREQRDLLAR